MLFMILICIYSASLLFILHHYHILHHARNTLQLCYPCSNQLPLQKSQDSFPTRHTTHSSSQESSEDHIHSLLLRCRTSVVVAPAEVADASTAAAAARGSISSEALALIFNLSALCNLSEQKTVLELGLVCSNAGTVEFALTDYFGSQKARIGSSDGQFYWTCNLTN